MNPLQIDFTELKTSWTKYDIVQALDVVYSVDTIQKYKRKEAKIDERILRSFLGIKSLDDPIPDYWIEIQKFPIEKKIFSLLALIFTHGGVVKDFATKYSQGNMKGLFYVYSSDKQLTNIRSALVVAEATEPTNRRKEKVPYDFSVVYYNPKVGKLFKKVLLERISRFIDKDLSDDEFYEICLKNEFHKALSLTHDQFRTWLEGDSFDACYVRELHINNFLSIKEPVNIDFEKSKEIYFLGENGDGKSLIIMAVCLAFNGNYIKYKTEKRDTGIASDILDNNSDIYGVDEWGHKYNLLNAIYLQNLYAYGTHRGRYNADPSEKYGFMSLFNNNLTLNSPEQWLKNIKLEEEQAEESHKGIRIATKHIETVLYNLLEKNVKTHIEGSNVFFEEKGCYLNIDQLSEGYRSIIIFICDLLYRLYKNNEIDIFNTKGVVLVDEIDQHLHLKWQRVIVSKLRQIFPKIQFIFTTHSPTIIQGASEDAIIFRTYRINGITKVSEPYYRKELDHLMMNTLVTSSLFGLEDSRLNTKEENADTNETYLLYKINQKLISKLQEQKKEGKNFISENEIDSLIDTILRGYQNNEEDK
jgi:Predicted ATP-binding protein involved in virulence